MGRSSNRRPGSQESCSATRIPACGKHRCTHLKLFHGRLRILEHLTEHALTAEGPSRVLSLLLQGKAIYISAFRHVSIRDEQWRRILACSRRCQRQRVDVHPRNERVALMSRVWCNGWVYRMSPVSGSLLRSVTLQGKPIQKGAQAVRGLALLNWKCLLFFRRSSAWTKQPG